MNGIENIKVSWSSVMGNKLRTYITASIIAIGIMALVGMLTAIDGLEHAINQNFARMGANTFSIRDDMGRSGSVIGRRRTQNFESITLRQATQFKEQYAFPGTISLSSLVSNQATVRSFFAQSNPNTRILAVDENYLELSGTSLWQGRNFSGYETEKGNAVAIIGYDLATGLFPFAKAIDSTITFQGIRYKVIGIAEKKGGSMGFGGEDRVMYIPIQNAKSLFLSNTSSYIITGGVNKAFLLKQAVEEAELTLRQIRRLNPEQESSFRITQSDSLSSSLLDNLKALTITATLVSIITLIGAAIGLMNIMLVSVTERTREIGTRIAIGAQPSAIKKQFLIEALIICQLGGIMGTLLGISIGNGVGILMNIGFIIPWFPIILAFTICLVVGLVAGYYPAKKASQLNPIDALRHE